MLHSVSPHPVQCLTVGKGVYGTWATGFPKLNFDHVRNGILLLSPLDMLGAKWVNITSDVTL